MQITNIWLENAKDILCREIFKDEQLAEKVHISYGFPSTKAFSEKSKALGEAWQTESGVQAIFVSPTQFDPENYVEVLGILVHELIHIKIGCDLKHGAEFKRVMREVDLVGKATATEVGCDLGVRLNGLKSEIGEIPQAELVRKVKKTQSTRLCKLVCECPDPRILRVSKKVADGGDLICGVCRKDFRLVEEGG